jgi:hypothetical protein
MFERAGEREKCDVFEIEIVPHSEVDRINNSRSEEMRCANK